jgi:hypothetical protein
MKVQSLSINIPTKGCINSCKFCVSRLHQHNQYEYCGVDFDRDLRTRLQYAREEGCNTVILTGQGEVLQTINSINYLEKFFEANAAIKDPFLKIELQTTGVKLDAFNNPLAIKNLAYLAQRGVNTIALSVADIFSDENNMKLQGVPTKYHFELKSLCEAIKAKGFNLRLSLNMLKHYSPLKEEKLMARCQELGAAQVTFRQMYYVSQRELNQRKNKGEEINPEEMNINDWIQNNMLSTNDNKMSIRSLQEYILKEGTPLYRLPFGAMLYSIKGMSIVLDNDCMSKSEYKDVLKYLVLRENCKLYTRWDDDGSLVF